MQGTQQSVSPAHPHRLRTSSGQRVTRPSKASLQEAHVPMMNKIQLQPRDLELKMKCLQCLFGKGKYNHLPWFSDDNSRKNIDSKHYSDTHSKTD